MRTRVVVWIVVGVVIAAGVIFIVATSGKTPPTQKTAELLQVQANKVLGDLQEVEAQANAVRQQVPQGVDVAGLFERFDSLAANARVALESVKGLADANQADLKLVEGRKATSEARQTLKKIERTLNPRRGR